MKFRQACLEKYLFKDTRTFFFQFTMKILMEIYYYVNIWKTNGKDERIFSSKEEK